MSKDMLKAVLDAGIDSAALNNTPTESLFTMLEAGLDHLTSILEKDVDATAEDFAIAQNFGAQLSALGHNYSVNLVRIQMMGAQAQSVDPSGDSLEEAPEYA